MATARRPSAGSRLSARAPQAMLWLFVIYLVLEYVRPPVIASLRLQMIVALIVPLVWLAGPRPWSSALTLQLAFVAWCAKGIALAPNYYAAYLVTRVMYAHFAIDLAVTWIGSDLASFRRILWFWFGIILYSAGYSIAHGGFGLGGFMEDENDLALAAVTALPLAIMGVHYLRGGGRWVCAGSVALLLLAAVVSFSRGGFVGLVGVVVYCLFAHPRKAQMLAAIAVGGLCLITLAPPEYIAEIKSIQETNEGTARGRRFLWAAAFNMWTERPILGWGGGNTNFMIGRYQPDWRESDYRERDWTGAAVHSTYFQILPEHGAVGVFMFAALAFLQVRTLRRLRRFVRRARDVPPAVRRDTEFYSRALNGMLVGYLISGAFLSVAYYPYFWYITALGGALSLAVRNEVAPRLARRPARDPVPASAEPSPSARR